MNKEIVIRKTFRWKIAQCDDNAINIIIPTGDGPRILNPQWVVEGNLSDREVLDAEMAVLNAVAEIK